MKQRRAAFGEWNKSTQEEVAGPNQAPPSPLDMIPTAEQKRRNRSYEKRNRTFTYRLSDKEIGAMIAAVAQSLQVTADEVARAFVEAGMREARLGHIPFDSISPAARRMTLYPTGAETWSIQEQSGWPKPIPARSERKKPLSESEKRKRQQELNQFRVSYRWPEEVDKALTDLTESVIGKVLVRSDGRKGWVLTILLRYGLSAYEAGRLPLQPQPKVVKMELTW